MFSTHLEFVSAGIFLSFLALTDLYQWLLACVVTTWSLHSCLCLYSCVDCVFFSLALYFLYQIVFSKFIMIHLTCFIWVYIVYGLLSFLELWIYIFIKFGNFLTMTLEILFLSLWIFVTLWMLHYWVSGVCSFPTVEFILVGSEVTCDWLGFFRRLFLSS